MSELADRLQRAIVKTQGESLFAPEGEWSRDRSDWIGTWRPDLEDRQPARPEREWCATAARVRFPSLRAAEAELEKMRTTQGLNWGAWRVRPLCQHCNGYHLTSKNGKPWASGKEGSKNPRRRRKT